MDNSYERRQAVKKVLWQARHEREEQLHRDIDFQEQADWLGVSYRSYVRWENGSHLPRSNDWPHLIQKIGPRMALALGLPENISPELLNDWRWRYLAENWDKFTDSQLDALIAIAKKSMPDDPQVQHFLTELLQASTA